MPKSSLQSFCVSSFSASLFTFYIVTFSRCIFSKMNTCEKGKQRLGFLRAKRYTSFYFFSEKWVSRGQCRHWQVNFEQAYTYKGAGVCQWCPEETVVSDVYWDLCILFTQLKETKVKLLRIPQYFCCLSYHMEYSIVEYRNFINTC